MADALTDIVSSVYIGCPSQTKSPSELAALSFAEAKLQYTLELAQQQQDTFPPELHFLCELLAVQANPMPSICIADSATAITPCCTA